MLDLGPHATFIIASYAAVVVVIAGLTVWLVLDGRKQRAALSELEARGARRRSTSPSAT